MGTDPGKKLLHRLVVSLIGFWRQKIQIEDGATLFVRFPDRRVPIRDIAEITQTRFKNFAVHYTEWSSREKVSILTNWFDRKELAGLFRDVLHKVTEDDYYTVEYELLDGSYTQQETEVPQYYLWVTITDNASKFEGAARMTTKDSGGFEVSDWLTKTAMVANPHVDLGAFPPTVREKIEAKISAPLSQTEMDRVALFKYSAEAAKLSDADLIDELVLSSQKFLLDYDRDRAFKVGAFEREAFIRKLHDVRNDKLYSQIIEKYHPCFGIPEGDCRE